MQKLIDKKRFDARCEYCRHARIPEDRSIILCAKKGVVDFSDSCRHYKYDPLKREPNRVKLADNYTAEDFKL